MGRIGGRSNESDAVPDPIREALKGLDQADVERLTSLVAPILDTQRARIEYAESRRSTLAAVGGVLLAAGIAALIPIASSDFSYYPLYIGLLVGAAALTLTGAAVLVLYGRQTNWSYPFKTRTSVWKWFYRDALPGADAVSPRWHTHERAELEAKSQSLFDANRAEYAKRIATLTNAHVNLEQDVQQTYILHWNEFYKNKFLTHLRKVLIRGVVTSLLAGAIAFGIAAEADPGRYNGKGASVKSKTHP